MSADFPTIVRPRLRPDRRRRTSCRAAVTPVLGAKLLFSGSVACRAFALRGAWQTLEGHLSPTLLTGCGDVARRTEYVLLAGAAAARKGGAAAPAAARFPHEFSGGQRQRIGIARALAVNPQFIVADEPVSALDVSIQAQIINLLQDLRQDLGLSILFIGHDLSVIEFLCDRVVVMYLGKIMETATAADLYARPRHPYTRALLDAAPIPDPRARRQRITLKGDLPSPINPPSGCVFRTRCPFAIDDCAKIVPPLETVADRHAVACIRQAELNLTE